MCQCSNYRNTINHTEYLLQFEMLWLCDISVQLANAKILQNFWLNLEF